MNPKRSLMLNLPLRAVLVASPLDQMVRNDGDVSKQRCVTVNHWESYTQVIAATVDKIRETYPLEERDRAIRDVKVFNQKLYLGPRFRSFTTAPKIITPRFCEQLRVQNDTRRREAAPMFVRMAELLREIEHLEELINEGHS